MQGVRFSILDDVVVKNTSEKCGGCSGRIVDIIGQYDVLMRPYITCHRADIMLRDKCVIQMGDLLVRRQRRHNVKKCKELLF